MGNKKVAAKGSGNVLKELKKPIEELNRDPGIRRVNPGKSFNRGGDSYRGMRIGNYDPVFHSLKISCYTDSGGQELYLIVPASEVERVKRYVMELSQKYFR